MMDVGFVFVVNVVYVVWLCDENFDLFDGCVIECVFVEILYCSGVGVVFDLFGVLVLFVIILCIWVMGV